MTTRSVPGSSSFYTTRAAQPATPGPGTSSTGLDPWSGVGYGPRVTDDDLGLGLRVLHGTAGIGALIAGAVAWSLRKAPGAHPRAGRIFFVAMATTIGFALPILVRDRNLFLTGLGSVAALLAWGGWRVAVLRPPAKLPSAAERRALDTALVLLAAFAAHGALAVARGHWLGLALTGIAALGLSNGWSLRRFFADPQGGSRGWVELHLRLAGGSFVAGLTAFSAAVLSNLWPTVPEAWFWLGPPAAGVLVLRRTIRTWRQSAAP